MLPNLFLYSRADTIYGGTNQIQRNLIAERGWACRANQGG
jgi:alkylation response protein AidB-like acyl-CoA dehydrogenase